MTVMIGYPAHNIGGTVVQALSGLDDGKTNDIMLFAACAASNGAKGSYAYLGAMVVDEYMIG